jgi:hypothetical protein
MSLPTTTSQATDTSPRARVRKTRPAIFVCSFSGALGDMTRKDQSDPLKVLAVLKQSPRFSVWDATDNKRIANTMTDLMTDGLIDYPEPQPGFPWSQARVTAAGISLLEGSP